MNEFATWLKYITSDAVVFPLFQGVFAAFFLYAWAKDRVLVKRRKHLILEVSRGKETWNYFHLAYLVLSVVFIEINSSTSALKAHKTIITLIDLAFLMYLCYFSSYFRNKIIGIVHRSEQLKERH